MSTTDVNFNYSMVTSEDPYATLQGGNSFDILTSYGEHSFSYGYEEGDFIYMFGSNSYTDAGPDNDFIVAYSDDDTVVTGTGSDTINTANLAGSARSEIFLLIRKKEAVKKVTHQRISRSHLHSLFFSKPCPVRLSSDTLLTIDSVCKGVHH